MFKSVEYGGFDSRPELRKLAEQGTVSLAGEIGTDFHNSVDVVWEAYSDPPTAIELELTLTLPIGAGACRRLIPVPEFADEGLLRSRFRDVWDRTLGALLDKRKKVWEEILREPVGT